MCHISDQYEQILAECQHIQDHEQLKKIFENLPISKGIKLDDKAESGFDFLSTLLTIAPSFGYTNKQVLCVASAYLEVCGKLYIHLEYKEVKNHPILQIQDNAEFGNIKEQLYRALGLIGPREKLRGSKEIEILSLLFQRSDMKGSNIVEFLSQLGRGVRLNISYEQQEQALSFIKANPDLLGCVAAAINNCPNIHLEAVNHFSNLYKETDLEDVSNRDKLFSLWNFGAWIRITNAQELMLLQLINDGVITEARDIKLIRRHCARIRHEIQDPGGDALKPTFCAVKTYLPNNLVLEEYEQQVVDSLYDMLLTTISGDDVPNREAKISAVLEYMLARDKEAFIGVDPWSGSLLASKKCGKLLDVLIKKKAVDLSTKIHGWPLAYWIVTSSSHKALSNHYNRQHPLVWALYAHMQAVVLVSTCYLVVGVYSAIRGRDFLACILELALAASVAVRIRAILRRTGGSIRCFIQLRVGLLIRVMYYITAGIVFACDYSVKGAIAMLVVDVLCASVNCYEIACYERPYLIEAFAAIGAPVVIKLSLFMLGGSIGIFGGLRYTTPMYLMDSYESILRLLIIPTAMTYVMPSVLCVIIDGVVGEKIDDHFEDFTPVNNALKLLSCMYGAPGKAVLCATTLCSGIGFYSQDNKVALCLVGVLTGIFGLAKYVDIKRLDGEYERDFGAVV